MSAVTAGRELTPQEMAKPGSPEHTRMVTSSKVASMLRDENGDYLGIGYDSAYDMWSAMAGQGELDRTGMEDIFRYGHAAERLARYWLQDVQPEWRFSPGEVAFGHHPDLDFPHQATLDMRASRGRARKIIEVKAPRVDRGVEDNWRVQCVMNMGISGIHECQLVIVPMYGPVAIYDVEWDPELFEVCVEDAREFYRRVVEMDAPPHEGSALWREQQGRLHKKDETADPVIADGDLVQRWQQAVQELDAAERKLETVKNDIVAVMGDAPCVKSEDDRRIVGRTAGRFSQRRLAKEYLEDESLFSLKFDSAKLKKQHPDVYAQACGTAGYTFNQKEWK